MSNSQKPRRSESGCRGRRVYVVALAAVALLGLSRVDLGAVSATMRQQDDRKPVNDIAAQADPAPVITELSSLVTTTPVMLASLTAVGVTVPQSTADTGRLPAAPGPEAGELAALAAPAAAIGPGVTAAVSEDLADPAPIAGRSAPDAADVESYVVIGSYARLEVAARHVARNRHWKPVILPVMVDGRRRNLVAIGPFLQQQLAETLQLVIWDGFGDAWTFSPGSDSRIQTALTDGPIGSGRYR